MTLPKLSLLEKTGSFIGRMLILKFESGSLFPDDERRGSQDRNAQAGLDAFQLFPSPSGSSNQNVGQ